MVLQKNVQLFTLVLWNPCYICISYTSAVFFSLPFHLSPFLNPRNIYCKGVFSPLKCPSNLLVWVFYFIPLLVFPSTDSYCPLSELSLHPFCLADACHVCQLVESLKFTSGTLLTFPFSLSPPLSPLLLFSLLPVAAAERLYSQLERNRLLSNELKLTLHDLCDWWQGSLMPIKPSLLLTPLTWTPAKSWLCF